MSSAASLVQPAAATPSGFAGQSPAVAHLEGEGAVQKRSVVYAEAVEQMPPPALQSVSERQGLQNFPSPVQLPAFG